MGKAERKLMENCFLRDRTHVLYYNLIGKALECIYSITVFRQKMRLKEMAAVK